MKKYFVLIAVVCGILFSCKPEPQLPSVGTHPVTEVTSESAVCSGMITDSGNAEITAKGFCWSTNQNPTLNDNVTTELSRIEPAFDHFTATIRNLKDSTTYYVRAFATNSVGTAYGSEQIFTTLKADNGGDDNGGDDNGGDDNGGDDNGGEIIVELPTVTTVSVSGITYNSASITAEVLTDGGADVTERGFIWNRTDAGEDNGERVKVGEGLGSYTFQLTALLESTSYYVKAYAVNSAGEVVSEAVNFTTEANDVVIEYEYVDLGLPSGVKWAMHNVGTTYPEGHGDHFAWGEIEPKATYEVGNCSSYYQDLGDISGNPLYDAAAAKWGNGWRMPTLEEMYELTQECIWTWVEDNGIVGYKVTSKTNGNHIFLPAAGFRVNDQLIDKDFFGYYWMSTPYEEEGAAPTFKNACFLDMCSYQFYCNWSIRRNGMTIRPVKD